MSRYTWDRGSRANNRVIGIAVALIVLTAAAAFGYQYWQGRPQIPGAISNQLDFSPLVLGRSPDYKADNFKYDADNEVLSYLVNGSGVKVAVSEQVQPPQFTEVEGYKDRFLSNALQQYAAVQTSNGTVYLCRPPKSSGKQVAIMFEKGLMIFFTPDSKDLSERQWRQLAEQFVVQKI